MADDAAGAVRRTPRPAPEPDAEELVNQTEMLGFGVERGVATLSLKPPREIVLAWVAAAREMLGDAPNYSETRVDFPREKAEMEVSAAGEYERFVFTVQRAGKVTPHEARQKAEAERDLAVWLHAEEKHQHAELLAQRDSWWDHVGREQAKITAERDALQARLATIAETLGRAAGMMATDSRDWGRDRSDVWLYGLIVGWECEEQHEHDEVMCGGDGALREAALQHAWSVDDVIRIRRFRAALQGDQLTEPESRCMNGPAKQHTLRMVEIIKALKAASADGVLPGELDDRASFAQLARTIVDHWPTGEPDRGA